MNEHYFTPQGWQTIPVSNRPKVRYWLPAAAVDQADLREEIRQLYERGFGGVEVVSLHHYAALYTSEDGWGGEHWNQTIQTIADTTAELGMTMDLTNGPGWPISMPTISSPDDPAAIHELTYGVTVCQGGGHYVGKLPQRRMIRESGTPELVHVLAYLQREDGCLIKDSYLDLRGCLSDRTLDATLDVSFPRIAEGGNWLIFAFYCQPSLNSTSNGRYQVIDHLSQAGVEACRAYWEPILEQCNYPSMESIFCDSMEYKTILDWTPLLPEEFEKRRGYSILPYLPFIGARGKILLSPPDCPGYRLEDPVIGELVNHDYLETLTQCYCEYHLDGLSKLSEKYGKHLRYQVAYNKPFEIERCGLYLDFPENEALGRLSFDYLKTMAASVHLGRRNRYSFECAAEFGHGYGQDYEDLLWWIKRSFMAGINFEVFHGASYSGAYYGELSVEGSMPGVEWPGEEAFGKGVSNYWNRTPSIPDARNCLDAIARLNAVFMQKAKVDCAVYRASYANNGLGGDFCLYADDGHLMNAGYSYEFVSPALLELPVCQVSSGQLDKEGVGYRALIVPEESYFSTASLKKIEQLLEAGFPVVWIGTRPKQGFFFTEWDTEEKRAEWTERMDRIWADPRLIHVTSIEAVPAALQNYGIFPRVKLDGTRDLITAVHVEEETHTTYYGIYAYNRFLYKKDSPAMFGYVEDTVKPFYQRKGQISRKDVRVSLEGSGAVYACNPWDGSTKRLDFIEKGGRLEGIISLEKDELLILAVVPEQKVSTELPHPHRNVSGEARVTFERLSLRKFGPNRPEEKSYLRSGFSDEVHSIRLEPEGLLPWKDLEPELATFVGQGSYEGHFTLSKVEKNRSYLLRLGRVSDTFSVVVNGKAAGFPDQVLKEVDITDLVQEGENQIQVIVTSNLYNAVVKEDGKEFFPMKRILRNYGIWESREDYCCVQILE